jgi:hypothetical protein
VSFDVASKRHFYWLVKKLQCVGGRTTLTRFYFPAAGARSDPALPPDRADKGGRIGERSRPASNTMTESFVINDRKMDGFREGSVIGTDGFYQLSIGTERYLFSLLFFL